jgi:putative heme iron utilization protein
MTQQQPQPQSQFPRRLLLVWAASALLCSGTTTTAFVVGGRPSVRSSGLLTTTTATLVNGDAAATLANGASAESSEDKAVQPPTPDIRLNVYEKARTVTAVCTSGTLCTTSSRPGMEGAPFGSYVDYVLDDAGNPILLMNAMSMHTQNIQQAEAAKTDGEKAVVTLFTQREGVGQDVSRCSLTGTLHAMDPLADDMDAIRMRYSITHAYADQVMDSPKFNFYRLEPQQIYFVGGFGVLAKWMEPEDYAAASPDILAAAANGMVERINRQHGEDLQLTAQHLLDVTAPIETIRLTNVDRLGLDIRVTSQMGSRRNKLQTDEFRIGFRIPVLSVEDAKSEILKVFQEAWEKANGFDWGPSPEEDGDMIAPGSSVPILKIAADSLE